MNSPGSASIAVSPARRSGWFQLISLIFWRTCQVGFVLFAVSLLTFLIMNAMPGTVIDARIGPLPNFSPEERERIVLSLTKQLGLDKPLWHQYFLWLRQVAGGDFGFSYQGLKVSDLISARFGPTLELGLLSVVFGVLGSFVMSILAFRTRFRFLRGGIQGTMTVLLVVPAFWLGLLLVILMAAELNLLPSGGFVPFGEDSAKHFKFLVLPTITLALPQAALYFRYLYSGLRDVENSQFVTASRARGISEGAVVYRHVLPNAVIPTITVIGLVVGSLISGLVIVETVFSWPGLGSLLVKSVEVKDYSTVSAIVLITAILYVLTAFLVDLLYELVDPRTRRRA